MPRAEGPAADVDHPGDLQKLPSTQRAVLIMRDVLGFAAAEVADCLETSVASVNSALQRARATLDRRPEPVSQQAALRELGESGRRELVDAYVAAWERSDVDELVGLLAADARFTMPPLPAWFSGRTDIRRFATERLFLTPWRLVPMSASGQLAFACYLGDGTDTPLRLGAMNLLTLRGREIVEISGSSIPLSTAGSTCPSSCRPEPEILGPTDEFGGSACS